MIGTSVSVFYIPTSHPTVMTWPNDYKHPVFFDEKKIGGKYDFVRIEKVELECIDHGSYYDPPIYEPIQFEEIIVRPKVRYWGKGIRA